MRHTTIETITDAQIRALGTAAAEAGDIEQAAICARAVGEPMDGFDIDDAETDRVLTMTQDDARAACVRAINHAEAQE